MTDDIIDISDPLRGAVTELNVAVSRMHRSQKYNIPNHREYYILYLSQLKSRIEYIEDKLNLYDRVSE